MPVDYLSGLGKLPDPMGDINRALMQRMGMEQVQLQNEQMRAQMTEAQAKQERVAQFETAAAGALQDPTPGNISNLIIAHPEYAEQIKKGWDIRDAGARQTDLTQLGEIFSAGSAGKFDLAAKAARRRYEADLAAGHADDGDKEMVDALESGDPAQQKAALGMIGVHLAAATGPDHFGTVYGALNKGADDQSKTVGRSIGHYETAEDGTRRFVVDYRDPDAPQYRSVGDGETLVEVGGGSAPTGNVDADTAWQRMIKQEGGTNPDGSFRTSPAGAIGPAQVMPGTAPEAAKLAKLAYNEEKYRTDPAYNLALGKAYYEKQLSDFGDPILAAAAYNAGPGAVKKALAKGGREGWVDHLPAETQNYVKVVGGVSVGGGARVVAQGKPKVADQYRILTPAENTARGLDPNVRYQVAPNGQITALGGQEKSQGQMKPVPQAPAKMILENHSTVREIDRAIALLKARPQSIGYGTGALGDWFTQRNDPEGVSVRAALGKIGGKIIHDVSGAAVTMSEAPRFQPYVPAITDAPETALNKLQQMRELAAADTNDLQTAWGPENGYRGVKLPGAGGAPVKVRSVQEAKKLPAGTLFTTPDGRTMRKR